MEFFEAIPCKLARCVQSLPLCLSLSSPLADDRNGRKYIFRSCSLALLPHDFAFLRDEMEDEVPTATPIPPSPFVPRLPFVWYLDDPGGHADSAVGNVRKCSPSDGTGVVNFQVKRAIVLGTEG